MRSYKSVCNKHKISILQQRRYGGQKKTDLISIPPEIVLSSNVLVGVLGAVLESGFMLPVFPVLIPKIICIDSCDNQGWRYDTVFVSIRRQNRSLYFTCGDLVTD